MRKMVFSSTYGKELEVFCDISGEELWKKEDLEEWWYSEKSWCGTLSEFYSPFDLSAPYKYMLNLLFRDKREMCIEKGYVDYGGGGKYERGNIPQSAVEELRNDLLQYEVEVMDMMAHMKEYDE